MELCHLHVRTPVGFDSEWKWRPQESQPGTGLEPKIYIIPEWRPIISIVPTTCWYSVVVCTNIVDLHSIGKSTSPVHVISLLVAWERFYWLDGPVGVGRRCTLSQTSVMLISRSVSQALPLASVGRSHVSNRYCSCHGFTKSVSRS